MGGSAVKLPRNRTNFEVPRLQVRQDPVNAEAFPKPIQRDFWLPLRDPLVTSMPVYQARGFTFNCCRKHSVTFFSGV